MVEKWKIFWKFKIKDGFEILINFNNLIDTLFET